MMIDEMNYMVGLMKDYEVIDLDENFLVDEVREVL